MNRRYQTSALRCGRCDAPMSLHLDDNVWVGCPYPQDRARHCAYQGCTDTTIKDTTLWLCEAHTPSWPLT